MSCFFDLAFPYMSQVPTSKFCEAKNIWLPKGLQLRKDFSPKPLNCIINFPIGPKVVPFWGPYLEFYKVIPQNELLWGLWVNRLNRGLKFRV